MAEDPSSTVRVDADTGGARNEIQGLGGIFGGLFGTIASGAAVGGVMGTAITGALSAIGNAVTAPYRALKDLVTGIADAGDGFFTLSRQTGLSVEALSAFKYVGAQTGVSVETLASAAFKMGLNIEGGGKKTEAAFKAIGLSSSELKRLAPEQQFETIVTGLGKIPDSGQRAAAGFAIFGRQFKDIAQLTQEDLGALMNNAREFGLVMSDEMAAAGDAFGDTLSDISSLFQGLKNVLGSALLPVVNAFLGTIRDELVVAFRMVKDAFGPLFQGFTGFQTSMIGAGQSADMHTRILKFMITIVAGVADAFGMLVRAASFVVSVYYEMRIAGNLLLTAFGKVVEGVLVGAQAIANGMAKVSLGETRKSFERDAAQIGDKLGEVRGDLRRLGDETAGLDEKKKTLTGTMNRFADGIHKGADELRKQAAEYKGVATQTDVIRPKVQGLGEDFDLTGDAAKKTTEKVSQFANTATKQIGDLAVEWRKQPAAVRANEESINILLDKYVELRKKVTDKSQLPADLENIYIMSGRAVPVIAGLGKEFENVGKKVPIPTLKELMATMPPMVPVVNGLGKEFENVGTKVPIPKIEELIKLGPPLKEVWSSTLDSLAGAFEKLANISGGAFGGIAKHIGEVIGQMKVADAAGKAFDTGLTTLQKGGMANVATGAAGMAAGIFSGIGAMQQATNHASATKNVLGGMASGMAMGMQIAGPWGAAVGAAVGAIWGAFKGKPDWAKIQSEIQRDFGVAVSEELAKEIEKTNKLVKDRSTAIMLNMSKILQEAGGVTVSNLDQWTKKTADLFAFVERKQITMQQATEQFNAVFPQLAKVVTETNGLASKSFLQMMDQHDASMMKSEAVAQFVGQQMGKAISGLKAFTDNATITSQNAATATGAAVAAMFDKMVQGGMSASDALKAIGPVITNLEAQFAKAGFTGGDAFNQITALANTASNEIVAKGITAVEGLNATMRGLHNAGLMDQAMFSGLSQQIGETFNSLIAQGANGDHAMRLMQPTLQTLWEMQNRFGYSVDESTQKLLNEAHASGVVGSQYMSAQDRMAEATNRVANAIEFMAQKMGYIPQAAGQVASSMSSAFGTVEHHVRSSEGAFEHWRRKAIDAAHEVSDAVDEVSFGSSPGGLKEWAPMLMGATRAFGDVKSRGVRDIRDLKREVDSFGMGNVGDIAISGRVTRGLGGGGGGVSVAVDARGALFEEVATVRRIAGRVGDAIAEKHFSGEKAAATR